MTTMHNEFCTSNTNDTNGLISLIHTKLPLLDIKGNLIHLEKGPQTSGLDYPKASLREERHPKGP